VRIWSYPSLRLFNCLEGARGEIDDLDFDPRGVQLVSVGGTAHAEVWSTIDGVKDRELIWSVNKILDSTPCNFKHCRFGLVGGSSRLFTLMSPSQPGKKPCYLVSWSCDAWKEVYRAALDNNPACVLAVSPDSQFVAVGDTEGMVRVFAAADLQPITKTRAHGLFITALTFWTPPGSDSSSSVLSVSADRYCVMTPIVERSGSRDIILLFVGMVVAIILLVLFGPSAGVPGRTEV
jgi:WD40 repeat protein